MPFSRDTLTQVRQKVAADIQSALPGSDPLLRFSNLKITGDVQAGLSHLHNGYLDWISKQAVPFTATDEYLVAWAALKDVYLKDAVAWTGQVTFSGAPRTDIPSGTPMQRGDGVAYVSTADVQVGGGGSAVVPTAAVVPAAAGTCVVNTVMTLATSVPGVQSGGIVTASILPGADVEIQDSLRSRMLQAYQNPPQGGAQPDYVGWALDVAGVTRSWTIPNGFGTGTVVVYVMLDVSEAAFGGFPQGSNGVAAADWRGISATGDQLAVANSIYLVQPVTALVYVVAPIANPVNFTISGIAGASTATKAAISAAIADVLFREAAPGGVIDPATGLPVGIVDLSDIESAIAAVAGTAGFIIAAPTANITSSTGQLAVLGTVTYV